MSVANDALLAVLGQQGFPVNDNLAAPNASSQTTATRCGSSINRFTTGVANGSAVLPSSVSNEAEPITFVINDTPNAIKLFPFSGENQGGVLNAFLSIPAGQAAIAIRVPAQIGKGGGGGGTLDWRSAVIP